MARRWGVIGLSVAVICGLSACFSGGEVVEPSADTAALGTSDAADTAVYDTALDARGADSGGGADIGGVPADVVETVDIASRDDAGIDAGDTAEPDTGPACDQGLALCDETCVDLATDVDHCGDCATACEATAAHQVAACEERACVVGCEPGWVDLDADSTNGCELECEQTNGGVEICDGVDNDCNGVVDDGFDTGACSVGTGACQADGNYVCVDDDHAECDAAAGTPGPETCGDGLDNDCDGDVDEDDAVDAQTWYADADGDGYGEPTESVHQCEPPADYVADDTDCDDGDPDGYTQVQGWLDRDADGYTTGNVQTFCTDGSRPTGYVGSQRSGDCDDGDGAVNPAADEVCGDGVDNDCAAGADDAGAVDATTYYADCDGDGFGVAAAETRRACTTPNPPTQCTSSLADWTDVQPVGNNIDCRDHEPDAYPGQTSYFGTPMSGTSSIDKWDYNCDGSSEKRRNYLFSTCRDCFRPLAQGWSGVSIPPCGVRTNYTVCNRHNGRYGQLICGGELSMRTQTCH